MFNTAVSVWQGFFSFLLIAEFPTYMRILKPVRAASLGIAIIWNFFYTWAFLELFDDVYRAENGFASGRIVLYNASTLLLDMMYTYNFALHGTIMLLNLNIILYEMKIDWIKSDDYEHVLVGFNYYDYRLGWTAIGQNVWKFLNFFNPIYWIYKWCFKRTSQESDDLNDYMNQTP